MRREVHLIDEAGDKLVIERSELFQEGYAKCGIDFDWYIANGCVTLDDLVEAVGLKEEK